MNEDQKTRQDISARLNQIALDEELQLRLRQARYQALDSGQRQLSRPWLSVAAMAGMLLLALLILNPGQNDEALLLQHSDELAIIGSEDALEMYQELEFYVWLDQDDAV